MAQLSAQLAQRSPRPRPVTPAVGRRCMTWVLRPLLVRAGIPTPRPRAGMPQTIAATPVGLLARPSRCWITLRRQSVDKALTAPLSVQLAQPLPRRRPVTPAVGRRCMTWVLRQQLGPAGTLTLRPRAGTQRTTAA